MIEPVSAFGPVVRRQRRDCGMSQEELAAASGVGCKHLSEIERGMSDSRLTTVVALARGLGMTPNRLLWLIDEEIARHEQAAGAGT